MAFFVNVVVHLVSEVATIFMTDLVLSMSSEAEEIDEWFFFCFRRICMQVLIDTNFREHANMIFVTPYPSCHADLLLKLKS